MTLDVLTLTWCLPPVAAPLALPAPSPVLLLAPGPLAPNLPRLLSGQTITPLLADPGRRAVRLYRQRCELDRLLADLAAMLVHYPFALDVTIIPREGRLHIRRLADGNIMLHVRQDTRYSQISVYPPALRDRHGLPVPGARPAFQYDYQTFPHRDDLFTALRSLVLRHNVERGWYTN